MRNLGANPDINPYSPTPLGRKNGIKARRPRASLSHASTDPTRPDELSPIISCTKPGVEGDVKGDVCMHGICMGHGTPIGEAAAAAMKGFGGHTACATQSSPFSSATHPSFPGPQQGPMTARAVQPTQQV
jgi:hypothetical protein